MATKTTNRKLINGRMMTCPRCKKDHDLLTYVPLRMIEEFAEETTPIYKCPGCRWIFAPSDNLVREMLKGVVLSAPEDSLKREVVMV